MAESVQENSLPSPGSGPRETPTPRGPRRAWPWLLGAALVVVGGGIVVFLLTRDNTPERPQEEPLVGELRILIRPAAPGKEILPVDEAGALPVRAGDRMQLEVRFNQPALPYVVWLDCEGRVVPLYPWNIDDAEVEDANLPPPAMRPTRVMLSPMTIGKGWKFGKQGGLETVLLLARRSRLGEDVRLGSLLGPVPATKFRHQGEVAVLELDRGGDSLTTVLARDRGTDAEAQEADRPLLALLARLREQFEVVRAVRFAHEGQ
ncbi:MAG: DUF4384 domain-containing protein [Gemmataceae bacterium]|nr:DUF4384 domain-containing protein [Gemmataceae bacterium]